MEVNQCYSDRENRFRPSIIFFFIYLTHLIVNQSSLVQDWSGREAGALSFTEPANVITKTYMEMMSTSTHNLKFIHSFIHSFIQEDVIRPNGETMALLSLYWLSFFIPFFSFSSFLLRAPMGIFSIITSSHSQLYVQFHDPIQADNANIWVASKISGPF